MALSELLTPRIVKIQEMGLNTSRVTLEPLERGFGYTLGTALRRVLLRPLKALLLPNVKSMGFCTSIPVLKG